MMGTPHKDSRKRLFGSQSPTLSSPSKVQNYTGYLMMVGAEQQGDTGRRYFDIKQKIGEKDFINIRVMSSGVDIEHFRERKGKPVKLINIGDSCGTLFFNVQRGSRIENNKYALDFSNEISYSNVKDISVEQGTGNNIEGGTFLDKGHH